MRTCSAWTALVVIGGLVSNSHAQDVQLGFERQPFVQKIKLIELPAGAGAVPLIVRTSEPLPADAQSLVATFDTESSAIRQKAEQEIQSKRHALIIALQALQDNYTRAAKLDEAVAIREIIRQMKVSHLKVLPNPGSLTEYRDRIGESFFFDVTGESGYSVWGSEVYTDDSYLATATVHAGVLKVGQRGIVKVTIYKSPDAHRGSTQNGVTTFNWGAYTASYTVESAFSERTPPLSTTPTSLQPTPDVLRSTPGAKP